MSSSLIRAYRFFFTNAGYIVGQRAQGALSLARAEQYANENDWEAEWEWDECPDLSWMSERELEQEHEVLCCVLKDGDGNVLASLCGITDPDSSYRRVIAAELAAEALHSQRELNRICAD
jgi:hypothetical protein